MESYGIDDAAIFVWERQFLRLDDDAAADAFLAEVQRVKPVLIIIDDFLDLHSGDGFSGRELRPILDRIAALPQPSTAPSWSSTPPARRYAGLNSPTR